MKKYTKFLPHLFFLILAIFSIQFASIRCSQDLHALFYDTLVKGNYMQGLCMGINPITTGLASILNQIALSNEYYTALISLSHILFYYLIYITLAYIVKNKSIAYTFLFTLFFLGELFFYAASPLLTFIGYACLASAFLSRKSYTSITLGSIFGLCGIFSAVLLFQNIYPSYINPITSISNIYFTSFISFFSSYYFSYFFYLLLAAFTFIFLIYHKHTKGLIFFILSCIYFLFLFLYKGYYINFIEITHLFWLMMIGIFCKIMPASIWDSKLFFWIVLSTMICGFSDIYNKHQRYTYKEKYYEKIVENLIQKHPDSTISINAANSNINCFSLLQSRYMKEEFHTYSQIHNHPIYHINFPSPVNSFINLNPTKINWEIVADSILIPYHIAFYTICDNEIKIQQKGVVDYILCYKDSAKTQAYEFSDNVRFLMAHSQNKEEAYEGEYSGVCTIGVPYCMYFNWEKMEPNDVIEVQVYCKGSKNGYLIMKGSSLTKNINDFYLSNNAGSPSEKNGWKKLQLKHTVKGKVGKIEIYGHNNTEDHIFFDLMEIKVYRQ